MIKKLLQAILPPPDVVYEKAIMALASEVQARLTKIETRSQAQFEDLQRHLICLNNGINTLVREIRKENDD